MILPSQPTMSFAIYHNILIRYVQTTQQCTQKSIYLPGLRYVSSINQYIGFISRHSVYITVALDTTLYAKYSLRFQRIPPVLFLSTRIFHNKPPEDPVDGIFGPLQTEDMDAFGLSLSICPIDRLRFHVRIPPQFILYHD